MVHQTNYSKNPQQHHHQHQYQHQPHPQQQASQVQDNGNNMQSQSPTQYKGNFDSKQQSSQQNNIQQQIIKQQQFQQSPKNPNNMNAGSNNINNNVSMANGIHSQIIHTPASNTGKYKTSICRHFKNGNCQLGSTCHFAHGDDEMRTVSDPLPSNIPQQPKVVCNNFKTVKCRYYERGFCKNQNACCFAHGDGDLAAVPFGGFQGRGAINNTNNMVIQNHIPQQMVAPQSSKYTDSILLISILQNLEHVFPADQEILANLQYAQQIAKQGDQKGAFNIISDIMKDPKRTDEEKNLYNIISANAQMFYSQQQYFSQGMMQGYPQIPNQFVQTPPQQDSSIYFTQQQPFMRPQQQPVVQQSNKQTLGNVQGVQQYHHINPVHLHMQQQQLQQLSFQSSI